MENLPEQEGGQQIDEDTARKAVAHVIGKYTNVYSLTSTLRAKWLELYRASRIFQATKKSRWQSKIFVPKIFETLVNVTPFLSMNLPKIKLIPKGPEDIPYADVMSKFLQWQTEQMGMDEKLELWGLGAMIYGTYPAQVSWELTTKKIMESQSMGVQPDGSEKFMDTEKEVVDRDLPCFKLEDPFNFMVDPRAQSIEDADYCLHETKMRLDKMKEQPYYFNLDKLRYTDTGRQLTQTDAFSQERFAAQGIPTESAANNLQTESSEVKLIVYQGVFKESDDEPEDDYILTVASNSVLVRFQRLRDVYKHGRKTWIMCHDQPWPGEFYAVGTVEPLLGLQAEFNDITNQRIDNLNLILNRIWIYDISKGVEKTDLVSVPGATIGVQGDPRGAVVGMETPNYTQNAYQETDAIDRYIQTVSGITDFAKGTSSPGFNDTATGVSIVAEAARTRIEAKTKHVKQAYIKLLQMMLSLNEQFITSDQIARVLGPSGEYEFHDIPQEAFKARFDVSLQGSLKAVSPQDRQNEATAKLNFATQFKDGFQEVTPQGEPVIKVPKMSRFFEDVIRAFNESDIVDDYFDIHPVPPPTPPPPPEPEQMKESMSISVKFETLAPEIQALILQKAEIIPQGQPLEEPAAEPLPESEPPSGMPESPFTPAPSGMPQNAGPSGGNLSQAKDKLKEPINPFQ